MKYVIEPNGHVRITDDDSKKKNGCLIGFVICAFIIISVIILIAILVKINANKTNSQNNNTNYKPIAPEQVEEISDYFYYRGHSYRLYRLHNITGADAINYCSSLGGYFAHINDDAENQFLAQTIESLGYDIVYFGYSDEQNEGDWRWIDNEDSSYVHWKSGEPNNEFNEEHYALLSPDGTWNDGKFERDSSSGVIILCEWNTTLENVTVTKHISNFKSHISNITSSSYHDSETYGDKSYVYTADKAFDNDMSTCWVEGSEGNGIGESITVIFDDIYEINEISLWNGLCTNKELFEKNSRLRIISVLISDGSSYDFECSDGWDNRNVSFSFDSEVATSSVTIIIKSVYEGSKYKDTCISEIGIS